MIVDPGGIGSSVTSFTALSIVFSFILVAIFGPMAENALNSLDFADSSLELCFGCACGALCCVTVTEELISTFGKGTGDCAELGVPFAPNNDVTDTVKRAFADEGRLHVVVFPE